MEFIGAKSIRSYLADDAIAALDALPDGDEVGRLGRQSFRRPPPIVVDVSGTGHDTSRRDTNAPTCYGRGKRLC